MRCYARQLPIRHRVALKKHKAYGAPTIKKSLSMPLQQQDLWPGCHAFFYAVAGALLELAPNAPEAIADTVDKRSATMDDVVRRRFLTIALRLQSSFHEINDNQMATDSPDYSEASSRPVNKHEWHATATFLDIVSEVALDLDPVLQDARPTTRPAWPLIGTCLGRHLEEKYNNLSDRRQRESLARWRNALLASFQRVDLIR